MEKDCNQKHDSKIRGLLQGGDECRESNGSFLIVVEHKIFVKSGYKEDFLKKLC